MKYPSKTSNLFLNYFNLLRARLKMAIGINPLSFQWGTDRGLPIHRYYLEQFLSEFANDIHGNCLEFQQDQYTSVFGKSRVKKLDILHIDDTNPLATIIADLARPNDIPSNTFDCIICTHVLHVIYDFKAAVSELHRILKPCGSLLIAVPHVSMCGPEYHELWRFTSEGLQMLLAEAFKIDNIIIRAYGNSLVTAGDFRGLVANEFSKKELNNNDLRFASEVCARAIK